MWDHQKLSEHRIFIVALNTVEKCTESVCNTEAAAATRPCAVLDCDVSVWKCDDLTAQNSWCLFLTHTLTHTRSPQACLVTSWHITLCGRDWQIEYTSFEVMRSKWLYLFSGRIGVIFAFICFSSEELLQKAAIVTVSTSASDYYLQWN